MRGQWDTCTAAVFGSCISVTIVAQWVISICNFTQSPFHQLNRLHSNRPSKSCTNISVCIFVFFCYFSYKFCRQPSGGFTIFLEICEALFQPLRLMLRAEIWHILPILMTMESMRISISCHYPQSTIPSRAMKLKNSFFIVPPFFLSFWEFFYLFTVGFPISSWIWEMLFQSIPINTKLSKFGTFTCLPWQKYHQNFNFPTPTLFFSSKFSVYLFLFAIPLLIFSVICFSHSNLQDSMQINPIGLVHAPIPSPTPSRGAVPSSSKNRSCSYSFC